MDENKPSENNDGEVINVKVTSPEEAAETNNEPTASFIPTVEAAGDPPADEAQQTPASDQPVPAADIDTSEHTEHNTTHPEAQAPVPRSSSPLAAIIAAVVVAVGLAGLTVFAYMKQQESNKPVPAADNSSAQQETPTQEVDTTDQEIDEALKASDEADFSESELSDESLGL